MRTAGVALRKESVDRNFSVRIYDPRDCWSLSARRAWIEISAACVFTVNLCKSLSARRAWIEIRMYHPGCLNARSLSARRAWIEISNSGRIFRETPVALRKESVDRNKSAKGLIATNAGRSPQGERG